MNDSVMSDKILKGRTVGGTIFDILNYLFLILFALSILYPFWNLILASFARQSELLSLGFHLWIKDWTTYAWQYVLSENYIGVCYLNTIFRTVLGTCFTLLMTLCAAYPLAKRDLPARNIITIFFLITMFFSGGLIPLYMLIRGLGLIDNRWVLILPMGVNVYYVIIMRNFLMTIDQGVEESALVDGANYPTILFRIIMPLARPVVATVVLWTAVAHWNAWFDAMIYINDRSKTVLQILIRRLMDQLQALPEIQEFNEDMGIMMPPEAVKAATILITIGPIILLYPFVQRHFIRGIMIGSLKG